MLVKFIWYQIEYQILTKTITHTSLIDEKNMKQQNRINIMINTRVTMYQQMRHN